MTGATGGLDLPMVRRGCALLVLRLCPDTCNARPCMRLTNFVHGNGLCVQAHRSR